MVSATRGTATRVDADSRRWVQQLGAGHPRHHQTVALLHDLLRRVAVFETSRRRQQLRSVTWGYKFAMFEVSAKTARHAWGRQPPDVAEVAWDHVPDPVAVRPEDWLEPRSQLDALRRAIGDLTELQREVFVAVPLNEVPIDLVALKLGTSRNAVYKNLFDARRRLRARMTATGHPMSNGNGRDTGPKSDARFRPPGSAWSR